MESEKGVPGTGSGTRRVDEVSIEIVFITAEDVSRLNLRCRMRRILDPDLDWKMFGAQRMKNPEILREIRGVGIQELRISLELKVVVTSKIPSFRILESRRLLKYFFSIKALQSSWWKNPVQLEGVISEPFNVYVSDTSKSWGP